MEGENSLFACVKLSVCVCVRVCVCVSELKYVDKGVRSISNVIVTEFEGAKGSSRTSTSFGSSRTTTASTTFVSIVKNSQWKTRIAADFSDVRCPNRRLPLYAVDNLFWFH